MYRRFLSKDFEKSLFPSRRLFTDFCFIVGLFSGVSGLFYYLNTLCFLCYFPSNWITFFPTFLSPILIGTSILLWKHAGRASKGLHHKLGWEIFSTVAIAIFLINFFILSGWGDMLPFQINPSSLTIGVVCGIALIGGVHSITRQEKELARRGFEAEVLKSYPPSFGTFLVVISIATLFAASGMFLLTGSNAGGCGNGFSLSSNVCAVTLTSATLYTGVTDSPSSSATSNFTFVLNNPLASTTIISLALTGYGLSQISSWSSTPNGKNPIDFQSSYSGHGANAVNATSNMSFTFYPFTNSSVERINASQIYNYVIFFANGQSISGSLIAQ
jgi:hypothetical protein